MNRKILFVWLWGLLMFTSLACSETAVPPQSSPEAELTAVSPRLNRILSIDVTEAADGDFDAAVDVARSVGVQAVSLSVFWDEIEKGPGVFNPDPNWLEIANQYYPAKVMQVSLVISVIDTNNLRLPPDLAGKDFDDPEVIRRFKALLDFVAGQIPDLDLTVLAIGNEIDLYLGADAEQWQQYETFFRETAAYARTLWPTLPIGSKVTFDNVVGGPAPYIQSINRHSDALFVTYYPLAASLHVRQPEAVHDDFQRLTDHFPEKPIYLLEVGYPSGSENQSSQVKQAAFIHELFQAWDTHAEQIRLISYTWLTDMSPESVRAMTEYYQFNDQGFTSFLASLGLRNHDGSDKAALDQWATESAVRGW